MIKKITDQLERLKKPVDISIGSSSRTVTEKSSSNTPKEDIPTYEEATG